MQPAEQQLCKIETRLCACGPLDDGIALCQTFFGQTAVQSFAEVQTIPGAKKEQTLEERQTREVGRSKIPPRSRLAKSAKQARVRPGLMLRLMDLFSSNHVTFLDPGPGPSFMALIKEEVLRASRPVHGKYSQPSREESTTGPIDVYTTPRRAREGPGTSSYTFVPSHAFNACHSLRSSNL